MRGGKWVSFFLSSVFLVMSTPCQVTFVRGSPPNGIMGEALKEWDASRTNANIQVKRKASKEAMEVRKQGNKGKPLACACELVSLVPARPGVVIDFGTEQLFVIKTPMMQTTKQTTKQTKHWSKQRKRTKKQHIQTTGKTKYYVLLRFQAKQRNKAQNKPRTTMNVLLRLLSFFLLASKPCLSFSGCFNAAAISP